MVSCSVGRLSCVEGEGGGGVLRVKVGRMRWYAESEGGRRWLVDCEGGSAVSPPRHHSNNLSD